MGKEKSPISTKEFAAYRTKLFARASDELKAFAIRLADYCWGMDEFAVVQEWGGEKEGLIVFGVPPQYRRKSNAKNYFAIYRVLNSEDNTLKCEVCFPIDRSRDGMLEKYDTDKKLHISTINQCEGMFGASDYDYVLELIRAARSCRVKA